jgi:hypothetical protein
MYKTSLYVTGRGAWMTTGNIDMEGYFAALHARRYRGEWMLHRKVSRDGWSPVTAGCHENVNHWVSLNPELKAVCGWMIVSEDESGQCRYEAHSVIEDAGRLYDITLRDQSACDGIRFLRHNGTAEEFSAVLQCNCRSHFIYPPFTDEEFSEA